MAEIPLPYKPRAGQPTCSTCRWAQVIRADAFGLGNHYVECRYNPPRPQHGFPCYNGALGWCRKHEANA